MITTESIQLHPDPNRLSQTYVQSSRIPAAANVESPQLERLYTRRLSQRNLLIPTIIDSRC